MELDHTSGLSEGETEDVSANGLYVRADLLLPVGDLVELRLILPSGAALDLQARVAHVLSSAAARALGRHAGMGLALVGADDTVDRAALLAHLATLRSDRVALSTTTPVMVVEPNAPMRGRMARCLEAAGFAVEAVASAMDALDACTTQRPDAMIAAFDMPAMTGVDLAYAMSEHKLLSDVPLILTGDDGDHGRLEAYRAGVRDVIPLPFLDEELVIRVHRVAAPPQSSSPSLRGSLVDLGLGTLLSLLELERKSGVLLVIRPPALARVFIAAGKILKVEMTSESAAPSFAPAEGEAEGDRRGAPIDRVMRLLDWRDGQFEFSPAEVGGRDELGLSVTQILLEHARTRDEQQRAEA